MLTFIIVYLTIGLVLELIVNGKKTIKGIKNKRFNILNGPLSINYEFDCQSNYQIYDNKCKHITHSFHYRSRLLRELLPPIASE